MITLLTLIAGAELVSSVVNAQTLDTLVNMDIHNFFYKAICLVVIFAFYLLFTYMLIRYQAYFNQKVATWLRDRISHSIEATSLICTPFTGQTSKGGIYYALLI